MARLNQGTSTIQTHEGAPAKQIDAYSQLRRSVLSCMLWENTFYENGVDIAQRISDLVKLNKPEDVAALAVEARTVFRLRHVPLLLARELARTGGRLVGDTLYQIIQRPDELTEFLSIYWKDSKQPLSKQVKLGLARAFRKFDAYQLAKYNRKTPIQLRDVLFLCHAKPKDGLQDALWKKLIDGKLDIPDTWETKLSAGDDKKATFTRLINEKKLGYMALLRNLRNMNEAGVDRQLVVKALLDGAEHSKALPFRFIAAMKACPQWEDIVDPAMIIAAKSMEPLPGRTVVVVDCSGSMSAMLSGKSTLSRFDAAAALAILVREIADDCVVYAYGSDVKLIPSRRGMALRDALEQSNVGWATNLGQCVRHINQTDYDRAIIITDEQSRDAVPGPKGKGYVINVAPYENGIGYGPWTHIDGFSEAAVQYIQETEAI